MSPPTKELMKLTLEQRIAHGGHPVLRWMMDNIFIRTDPAGEGNIKADKGEVHGEDRWSDRGDHGAGPGDPMRGMIQGNLFTIPGAFCLYKRVLPGQDSLQIYPCYFFSFKPSLKASPILSVTL